MDFEEGSVLQRAFGGSDGGEVARVAGVRVVAEVPGGVVLLGDAFAVAVLAGGVAQHRPALVELLLG